MKRQLFLVSTLLVLAACKSFNNEPQVDDAMLQHVPAEADEEIRTAQLEATKALERQSAAKRAVETAKSELAVAKQQLEVAEASVKQAELAFKTAETGTQEEVERARTQLADARSLPTAAKSRIQLRERLVDHAQLREALATRRAELAGAQVELEKARAVHALDRPQAKKIDLADYERTVRKAQEEVDVARVKLESSAKEVAVARTGYDEHVKAIPATYRGSWLEDEIARDREAQELEESLLLR